MKQKKIAKFPLWFLIFFFFFFKIQHRTFTELLGCERQTLVGLGCVSFSVLTAAMTYSIITYCVKQGLSLQSEASCCTDQKHIVAIDLKDFFVSSRAELNEQI